MRRFDWVWLSTDAQVNATLATYQDASVVRKLLGNYDFLPEATHIRGLLTPWMRIPVVFVSEGSLSVGNRIVFTPQHHALFGWRMRNVRDELAFDLPASAISSIEPAAFASPVARLFDIPFTRVRTNSAPPLDNFLLCAGGRIALPRIRAQSLELREELIRSTGRPAFGAG
jgi:hypothetical protein